MKVVIGILFFISLTAAVEPNFVKTTIYNVGKKSGTDVNLVTTDYSDGLGRPIQSKLKIDDTHDRTSCTFYDDVGRPDTVTKTFIDEKRPGSYLLGTFSEINSATGPLQSKYNDTKAYSYSKYSDDPLSRVIEQNGPGQKFINNAVKTWNFGVSKETKTITTTNGPYSISFVDGFITLQINGTVFDDILNELSDYLLSHNSAFTDPAYFLTVSKDAQGNYTQELKDLFGRTVATRAMNSSDVIIAQYSHDILGNLTAEVAPKPKDPIDPTKNINTIADSKYTYNTLGQIINKTTPDGGKFGYVYTLSGQLDRDISYNEDGSISRIRRYRYDDLDRQTFTELKNDNDLSHDDWTMVLRNYYDNLDALNLDAIKYNLPQWQISSLENLKGRLVASIAVNKVNGITYYVSDLFSYDDEGRIGKKIKIVPGLPLQEISYTYDLQGKVLTETTECGAQKIILEYQYDSEGRLEHVVHFNNSNKTLATYNYDELGRLDNKNLAITSGREIDYSYNIREWTTAISSPSGTAYPNRFEEIIPDAQYLANGNIGRAIYKYAGITSPAEYDLTYTYDQVNRLTGVTPAPASATNYSADYSYDVLGRFMSKTEGTNTKTGYAYYPNTNRIQKTASGNNKYYYDKHGNMVIDVNKKMAIEYDWRDMPVVFRFYNEMPTSPPACEITVAGDNQGTLSVNPKSYFETAGKTLLSQVVMLYDASGNRVLKTEGK
jgi:YD repeat-containing protein